MSKLLYNIKNYLINIDLFILITSITCSIYGVILVFSATASYDSPKFVLVQCGAIFIGIIAFVIFSLIDLENISDIWKIVFFLNLLLLASVLFFGTSGNTGNNSWIRFAGIGVQPGEIGKLLFIFTFATHTSLLKDTLNNWKSLLILLIHMGITAGFILLFSGDLGMGLAYIFICIVILFTAGLSLKWFLGGFISIVACVPIIWNVFLQEYQKLRILVVFDPSLDPDKSYQAMQSQLAIGSGGFYGTGFMQGNQTQFGALPAKHTDFIFSVAGEEFGFIGVALIIILLSALIMRLFYVSYKSNSLLNSLICAGTAGMILFQTFENIFMCLGILPVIGLTLPFFSYGGSSIVTMFCATGIVAGISMRSNHNFLR